ncbi:MAG TPA: BlaI/MecI/CopY family transcriptional regulator [Acidimicrobiales bacterium]|jgi:predicted transcriptional regulator|nr:BlaI/MecI/CopY family transcriptional regulator [Acidimicrobiales bacterium]
MRRLGQLEQKVMDALWEAPERSMSGREVADKLPDRAYTTVLTVLERLRRKEIVRRTTQGRVHYFQAAGTREAYIAEIMVDAMGGTGNRNLVLARFAESVSPEEAQALSRALQAAAEARDRS